MRTNIELDDMLVAEARQLSHIQTKRELVDAALREFVANRKRLDLRELHGTQDIRANYDYTSARRTRT
jgi:Arc/MetJ family transcription regulator